MSSTLTVAAAQIRSTDDPVENLETVRRVSAQAADRGAELVVFPEATMASFRSRLDTVAQPLDGPFGTGILATAADLNLTIVAGMFTPADQHTTATGKVRNRVRNTLLVAGPDGNIAATYDKVHLFDAFSSRESDTVAPGSQYISVDVAGWQVGLATCYDIRFADQFHELGRRGAHLIVVPTSWADGPGKADQWDLLTRARAHDAQAWLLGAAQAWCPDSVTGPFGIGRSSFNDPTGAVRARLDGSPDLLVATVDMKAVQRARATVPLLT
ncbi:carbon-nitrogen hydrolase family protein [Kribbia dieselivorans]|uniref:carbon-nitrogen hydrolase family protein n=1 Tax=Kribbia dieselivorans TaxID=331526 RepID=UPI0008397D76|nr:carbon-nitrogen hydrolase family protein [Kribbia dieselivorans]